MPTSRVKRLVIKQALSITLTWTRELASAATAMVLFSVSPTLTSNALAQPRDTLTIGITQYPSTFHPNIENMAAKSYVLGFARRPPIACTAAQFA